MTLLELLSTRKTFLIDEPLVSKLNLGGRLGFLHQELPPGTSMGQAEDVIRVVWGDKLAQGIAESGGLTPADGAAYDRFIQRWSTLVTNGMMKNVTVSKGTPPPKPAREPKPEKLPAEPYKKPIPVKELKPGQVAGVTGEPELVIKIPEAKPKPEVREVYSPKRPAKKA